MISDIISPRARRFADYYETLRRGDDVPLRSSFDPARMKPILDSFVILQVLPPDCIRFRLAGTLEVERYGHEVTGHNYLDYVPASRKVAAYEGFCRMDRYRCGMQAVIRSQTDSGPDILNEAIGFPFRCDRTGAIHLIFQSNDLDRVEDWEHDRLAVTSHGSVLRRQYFDVGFGLPPAD